MSKNTFINLISKQAIDLPSTYFKKTLNELELDMAASPKEGCEAECKDLNIYEV